MPKRKVFLTKEALHELYHGRGLSMREIGEQQGVALETIRDWMEKHGIPRRGCGQAGEKNPRWQGGRYTRSDGYVRRWTPIGRRLEHRLIMEEQLGRKLRSDEHVHHKNGDRSDNRLENLEVLLNADHASLHSKGDRNPRWTLSHHQRALVRRVYDLGLVTRRMAAKIWNVSPDTIDRIRKEVGE